MKRQLNTFQTIFWLLDWLQGKSQGNYWQTCNMGWVGWGGDQLNCFEGLAVFYSNPLLPKNIGVQANQTILSWTGGERNHLIGAERNHFISAERNHLIRPFWKFCPCCCWTEFTHLQFNWHYILEKWGGGRHVFVVDQIDCWGYTWLFEVVTGYLETGSLWSWNDWAFQWAFVNKIMFLHDAWGR